MSFSPHELEENVNVSATHPLAELAWLVVELAVLLVAVYLLLGWVTDQVASRMSLDVEQWLGQRALATLPGDVHPGLNQRLHDLLAVLPPDSPLHRYDFTVRVVPDKTVNAVALPGGGIVVFSGLLDKVNSENELAMILAHELGHFAHRDHLRGLGRGLGLAVAAQLLFGGDNAASEVVSKLALPMFARYSQQQETAADDFALDLLVARFGHAGGSEDFFRRMAGDAGGRLPYVLASHPHPQDRIDHLAARIAEQGYSLQPVVPLADGLRNAAGQAAGPDGATP